MNDDFFAEFDAMFAELARKARPGGFEPNADVYLTDDESTILVNVEIGTYERDRVRRLRQENSSAGGHRVRRCNSIVSRRYPHHPASRFRRLVAAEATHRNPYDR
jgi:hypothetical protein